MGIAELVFGIQALRLRVEAKRDLNGALGLRAKRYDHQVRAVQRILCAPRVRHLLADEVGLGKTVEALMVMAALRREDRGARFVILVPDHLARQWAEELLARAHEPAGLARWVYEGREKVRKLLGLGLREHVSAQQVLRLPAGRLRKLAADGVLDHVAGALAELEQRAPSPRTTVARLLLERAASSPPLGVILLTPRLVRELGIRLSPSGDVPGLRIGGLNGSFHAAGLVVDELHALPGGAGGLRQQVLRVGRWMPHLLLLTATPPSHDPRRLAELRTLLLPEVAEAQEPAGPDPDVQDLEAGQMAVLAEAVLRTRREDLQAAFPRRRLGRVVVEPLPVERHRERTARKLARALAADSSGRDPVRLLARAQRGRSSFQAALADLSKVPVELRAEVRHLRQAGGDSRTDALLDLLTELWEEESTAPVVVAVGDNPTLDDVSAALCDRLGLRQDQLFAIRQEVDALTMSEQARGFHVATGPRVLLVAGEGRAERGAYVGLNLQCSGNLVLFSIPWRHDVAEQLIGRLDRIGSGARDRSLVVTALVRRGGMDQHLLRLLEASGVFRRPLALDGAWLDDLEPAVLHAAVGDSAAGWDALVQRLEAANGVVAGAEEAVARAAWTQVLPELPPIDPVEPVLGSALSRPGGRPPAASSSELARLCWLQALHAAGHYELQHRPGSWGTGIYALRSRRSPSGKELATPEELRFASWGTTYFSLAAQDLEVPPKYSVEERSKRLPCGWLDAGAPLLEALARIWLRFGLGPYKLPRTVERVRVERCYRLPQPWSGENTLLVGAELDPVELLPTLDAPGLTFQDAHLRERRRALERLLRAWLRPGLVFVQARGDQVEVVPADDLRTLCSAVVVQGHRNAPLPSDPGVVACGHLPVVARQLDEALRLAAAEWWSAQDLPRVREALQRRVATLDGLILRLQQSVARIHAQHRERHHELVRGERLFKAREARLRKETEEKVAPRESMVVALARERRWITELLAETLPTLRPCAMAFGVLLAPR